VQSQTGAESVISRHRFVILFCTLVAFYVLATLLHQLREGLHPVLPPVVEAILFLALLSAAVVSVSKGRAWKLFVLLLGLPTVVLSLVAVVVHSDGVAITRHLFLAAFLAYVIWVMLRAIFDSPRVTFNTVCASLCIYLLLGLIWALVYSVVDALDPAAFTYTVEGGMAPSWLRGGRWDTGVVYFSFATLTTLGYGDIVPHTALGRFLAIFDSLFGMTLMGVIAGVILIYGAPRQLP